MAYLTIKKVNGGHYAYMQESFREGGMVRTRTVEYLGAVEPAVARQVKATRRQLGQVDRAALVQSVRAAALAVSGAGEATTQAEGTTSPTEPTPTPAPAKPVALADQAMEQFITTGKAENSKTAPPQFLHWPDDMPGYSVSSTALHRTQTRFAERLQAMGVDPIVMPKVTISYGHPDGMRRNRDGSYTITAARKPQNKRHQINKTKLSVMSAIA